MKSGTQWRIHSHAIGSRATGLDYMPVYAEMFAMRVPRKDWEDLMNDVRALESGALQELNR